MKRRKERLKRVVKEVLDNRLPLQGIQERIVKVQAKKLESNPPKNRRQQVKREPLQHPLPLNKLYKKSRNKPLMRNQNKPL